MERDHKMIAAERLHAIANILTGSGEGQRSVPAHFLATLRKALLTDPGLPKANPTVSLWQEPAHPTVATIQSPILPKYTDYLIIGSGITGCSVAKGLLDGSPTVCGAKPHVTVLEARTLASGATGRNGGHLVSPAGHYYDSLAKRHGEDTATDICRFSLLNVQTVIELVSNLKPSIVQESQLRPVTRVTSALDLKTWQDFEISLAQFRAALPEHLSYHTITQPEDIVEVSSMLLPT